MSDRNLTDGMCGLERLCKRSFQDGVRFAAKMVEEEKPDLKRLVSFLKKHAKACADIYWEKGILPQLQEHTKKQNGGAVCTRLRQNTREMNPHAKTRY